MKKILLALALCSANIGFAQSVDTYILKVENGKTYTPLTGATNLTAGTVWYDVNFAIPMGFTADIGGKSTSYFNVSAGYGFGPGSDTTGVVNTIMAFSGLDLEDRGWLSGTPSSPLQYLVTGTAPNRIFKFEASNVGFYDEEDLYGTLEDFMNVQIWLYETSNIVEVRYGSSKITYPSDYYFFGNSPLIGYAKDFDLSSGTLTKGYSLTGDPSAPTVDSLTSIFGPINVMSSFPANGTVYRFVPKAVAASIGEIDITSQFSVYPTIASTVLNIDQNSAAAASIHVTNISGQSVIPSVKLNKGNNVIDISSLSSGMYLLQLNTAEGKASYKFTKQ